MQPPVLRQNRQQIKSREFIGCDYELALLQFSQLCQRFVSVVPQVQEFFGIFVKYLSGIGENAFPRRTVEEQFAQFILELPDRLAYRRLGAVELFGSTGKPMLASHREENLEL